MRLKTSQRGKDCNCSTSYKREKGTFADLIEASKTQKAIFRAKILDGGFMGGRPRIGRED